MSNPHTEKPFGVLDRRGFGWGRYATKQEAEQRRAELELTCDSAAYPNDPVVQFDVVKVHP